MALYINNSIACNETATLCEFDPLLITKTCDIDILKFSFSLSLTEIHENSSSPWGCTCTVKSMHLNCNGVHHLMMCSAVAPIKLEGLRGGIHTCI